MIKLPKIYTAERAVKRFFLNESILFQLCQKPSGLFYKPPCSSSLMSAITKFRQVSYVVEFSVSWRHTLDVEQTFVSTPVIVSFTCVPSDLHPTTMWRAVTGISNWQNWSLLPISTFSHSEQRNNRKPNTWRDISNTEWTKNKMSQSNDAVSSSYTENYYGRPLGVSSLQRSDCLYPIFPTDFHRLLRSHFLETLSRNVALSQYLRLTPKAKLGARLNFGKVFPAVRHNSFGEIP